MDELFHEPILAHLRTCACPLQTKTRLSLLRQAGICNVSDGIWSDEYDLFAKELMVFEGAAEKSGYFLRRNRAADVEQCIDVYIKRKLGFCHLASQPHDAFGLEELFEMKASDNQAHLLVRLYVCIKNLDDFLKIFILVQPFVDEAAVYWLFHTDFSFRGFGFFNPPLALCFSKCDDTRLRGKIKPARIGIVQPNT